MVADFNDSAEPPAAQLATNDKHHHHHRKHKKEKEREKERERKKKEKKVREFVNSNTFCELNVTQFLIRYCGRKSRYTYCT